MATTRRRAPLLLLPLAAAGVLLLVWLRPAAPPPVAEARIEFRDPLAFLLQPPGAEVLSSVLPALAATRRRWLPGSSL